MVFLYHVEFGYIDVNRGGILGFRGKSSSKCMEIMRRIRRLRKYDGKFCYANVLIFSSHLINDINYAIYSAKCSTGI